MKEILKVWVVTWGYDYEGQILDGVFSTPEAAEARAREILVDHCMDESRHEPFSDRGIISDRGINWGCRFPGGCVQVYEKEVRD